MILFLDGMIRMCLLLVLIIWMIFGVLRIFWLYDDHKLLALLQKGARLRENAPPNPPSQEQIDNEFGA